MRHAEFENANVMGLRGGPQKVLVTNALTKDNQQEMLWSNYCAIKRKARTDEPMETGENGDGNVDRPSVEILNEGVTVDLVNVSTSLSDRKMYPKIGKLMKLDGLLDRRLKQIVMERKMRTENQNGGKRIKKDEKEEEDVDVEDCTSDEEIKARYESLHSFDQKFPCYSPSCPRKFPFGPKGGFMNKKCYTAICNELIALKEKLDESGTDVTNVKPDVEEKLVGLSDIDYTGIDTKNPTCLAKPVKASKKSKLKLNKMALPMCCKFETRSRHKSILLLPRYELSKLARRGGNKEVVGFNNAAKVNQRAWPYLCARPCFKTCYRYRTQVIKSVHAAALQLRVLWCCLRWDDMNCKPPPGGSSTITTENEVITTEVLKRRDVGQFGLRSEFLLRRIMVPIDLPSKPRGESFSLVAMLASLKLLLFFF